MILLLLACATPEPVDDACEERTWYADRDGDGFANSEGPASRACVAPAGAVEATGDCDDNDPEVHPDATEQCDDADQDEDCDGAADDADPEGATGMTTFFADEDDDGWADETQPVSACDPGTGRALRTGDCDDDNPDAHPGAEDDCSGQDLDCDGEAPRACRTLGDAHAVIEGASVAVRLGDHDGDGRPELGLAGATGLAVWTTAPAGAQHITDAPGTWRPNGEPTAAFDAGDLDGDGSAEWVLRTSTRAWWGTGTPAGDVSLAPPDWNLEIGDGADLVGLGDADGDGFADLCRTWSDADDGQVECFWGASPFAPTAPDGLLYGEAGEAFGAAVAGIGDIDGDGLGDLAVVADTDKITRIYLIPGARWEAEHGPSLAIATFTGNSGDTVSLARDRGDGDGDGTPDLLILATEPSGAATAHRVAGDLRGERTLDGGVRIDGEAADALETFTWIGDLDGGDRDGFLLGAPTANGGAGAVWLFVSPAEGSHLLDDAALRLDGETSGEALGSSVAGPGDVDGGGVGDLLLAGGESAWLLLGEDLQNRPLSRRGSTARG